MKTPISVVLQSVGIWLAVFAVLFVPKFVQHYGFNLLWLTVIIPNVLRLIVLDIPQLAVDRLFFWASTVVSMILMYLVNTVWRTSREAVKNPKNDRKKNLVLSFLLLATFAGGVLITYLTGIDSSIYSNKGWEN